MNIFERFFGGKGKETEKTTESQENKVEFEKGAELPTPQEQILEQREKAKSWPLKGGANELMIVELKDDGSAIFKPKKGEVHLRQYIEVGTYYKRERAAYLVNRFLNFDLVPPTVIRELDGEIGSAQEFIPNAVAGATLSNEESDVLKETPEFLKLWIFDYVIWSSDRNWHNFLVKEDKLYAIDNGLSFAYREGPMFAGTYYPFDDQKIFNKTVEPEIVENFKKFFSWAGGKEVLRGMLNKLLEKNEVDGCLRRIEKIGKIIEKDGMIPWSKRGELTP